MIQPATPTPLPALTVIGGAPGLPADGAAEGADFGALLALQGAAAAPANREIQTLCSAAPVAAPAATTGKSLPPVLPLPATEPEIQLLPDAPLLPAAISAPLNPVKPASKPDPAAKAQPAAAQGPEADPDTFAPPSAVAGEGVAVKELLVSPAQPAAILPATVPVPLDPVAAQERPVKTQTTPAADNPGQGPAHRTIPVLPATASETARARAELRTVQASAALTTPTLQPGQPVPQGPAPAPVPAEGVRIELALPRPVLPGALGRDEARSAPKLPEVVLLDAVSPLTPAPAQPQGLAAAQPAATPLVRPHDFAALIERIAVAREAAAPQTVLLTVTHQDFGQVRLSFRPEDSGLSVAMSSADPGFARAAAAAPVPVLPVQASEQAQSGPQQRGEGGSAQTGSQSQSRGGSPDPRRDDQQHAQPNPAPHGARGSAAPRTGIFA